PETAGLVDRPALDPAGAGAALSRERRAAVAPERAAVLKNEGTGERDDGP
ncbi:MAG: hypothetical protein H6R23_2610, partial [Proteobacteria bacterium]|nr:hypothetical protein [Pseudomonadota bacterium]